MELIRRSGPAGVNDGAASPIRIRCLVSEVLGRRDVNGDRSVIVSGPDDFGHLTYGPYELREPGHYRVEFQVALRDVPPGRVGDFICGVADVVANSGRSILAQRQFRLAELDHEFRTIALEFTLAEPRNVEYRVLANAQAALAVDADVILTPLAAKKRDRVANGSAEREWENESEFLDGYLRNVTGLIHIGANTGQERRLYQTVGLDVLWIEAMEDVYQILVDNIARYPRQRALRALLTDEEGKPYEFNVANNDGSSSILPLQDHAVIFPHLQYVGVTTIVSTTFAKLITEQTIDLSDYQALTLDIEGAEPLALRGAGELLSKFRYIKCEVSDFPSRTDAPTSADLDAILRPFGFEQLARRAFAYGPDRNGTYWDIVWKKRVHGEPLHRPGVSLPFIANDKSGWDWKMAEDE